MLNLKDIANMKGYLSLAMLFSSSLYALNAITVDSIFKKNNGVRSITSLDFLSHLYKSKTVTISVTIL